MEYMAIKELAKDVVSLRRDFNEVKAILEPSEMPELLKEILNFQAKLGTWKDQQLAKLSKGQADAGTLSPSECDTLLKGVDDFFEDKRKKFEAEL